MKLKIFAVFLLFNSLKGVSQEILTLEQCYSLAHQNHPLNKKTELLQTQLDWEIQALNAQKLPKIDWETQATYQSDVMVLPISLPNFHIDSPDKDQYKSTLTVSELIYNGGLIDAQKELKQKQVSLSENEIKTQLHVLKNQVNHLYFNLLLVQQKQLVLAQNTQQLQQKRNEIQKLIATGSTYESAVEPIEVKILELNQSKIELQAQQNTLLQQLSLLIGKNLPQNTVFESQIQTLNKQEPRTEELVFDQQKEIIALQSDLLKKQTLPKVSAFATAGYGKPGLNMLSNKFDDFYMAGINIKWNVFDFQANKKQRQALLVNQDLIENQRQVFQWNQNLTAQNYQSEIDKYQLVLAADQEIINYRKKIVETAGKQLKHDLITTSDYTAEINRLVEAQINQKSHEIALQLAQTNLNTTLYE